VQQRHALALLFAVFVVSFAGIAVAAARAGVWVIALAAGVLALWMGSLSAKAGRRR
jgi:hypothetical protein